MNKKNLLRLVLIIFFSTIHYAISQYVWDNLNERTKQTFEKAEAKYNLLHASGKVGGKTLLHPDNETRRQADSREFGGGHGNVKANIKAANSYLKKAENYFIKGKSTDIQYSAYYVGYALDFIGDSLTPPVSKYPNDKKITAHSKRYYNLNIPFNGTNKDIINNNKYDSFGRPETHTLTKMGLTKDAFLNKTKAYEDIVSLVSKAEKVNQIGSKVLIDPGNIKVLENEWKEWQKLVIDNGFDLEIQQPNNSPIVIEPTNTYLAKQTLMIKKHAAYALKAVMEYFKGTSIYGIWFGNAKAYEDLPIRPNFNKSETVILPKKVSIETEKEQWG